MSIEFDDEQDDEDLSEEGWGEPLQYRESAELGSVIQTLNGSRISHLESLIDFKLEEGNLSAYLLALSDEENDLDRLVRESDLFQFMLDYLADAARDPLCPVDISYSQNADLIDALDDEGNVYRDTLSLLRAHYCLKSLSGHKINYFIPQIATGLQKALLARLADAKLDVEGHREIILALLAEEKNWSLWMNETFLDSQEALHPRATPEGTAMSKIIEALNRRGELPNDFILQPSHPHLERRSIIRTGPGIRELIRSYTPVELAQLLLGKSPFLWAFGLNDLQ